MNNIIKTTLIATIILLVSACGFRQHAKEGMQRVYAQQAMNEIIIKNMPTCNPDLVDCGLITGAN